jgi:hypothetical protein
VLAAAAAAAATYALPFWPAGWWLGIGALAGVATALRPRLGLALTLLAPLLPLGNVSLGLALVYAAVAVTWVAACWRAPRVGLVPALGPLLAPLAALAVLPLALLRVRSAGLRAAAAAAAVLAAAAAAAIRHAALPYTGAAAPETTGIAGSGRPVAVVEELIRIAAARPGLLVEAAVLAAAAAFLPLAAMRGRWWIAGVGAAMLAAGLLAVPAAAAAPFVAAVWVTCVVTAVVPPGES